MSLLLELLRNASALAIGIFAYATWGRSRLERRPRWARATATGSIFRALTLLDMQMPGEVSPASCSNSKTAWRRLRHCSGSQAF